MARCFSCDNEIKYWAMMCGAFKHFKRNIVRRNLPVFDCPHCGVTCQEKAWSYYSFIAIFATVAISIMFKTGHMDKNLDNDWHFIITLLVCLFAGSYFWWYKVAKLKEPFLFWGN